MCIASCDYFQACAKGNAISCFLLVFLTIVYVNIGSLN
jgi:hypothetical protein